MSLAVSDLESRHRPVLEQALEAIRTRGYFSAFPESPSPKVYGESAAADGKKAFEALLGDDFPLQTPGADGTVATEKSPFGLPMQVSYPRVSESGVDALMAAARQGIPAWRDAGPLARTTVSIEILHRLHARIFALANAVHHTSGQAVVMVPASAIVTFAGIEKVMSVKDGKSVERRVQTGRREGARVEIVAGLEAGEPVVVEPGNLTGGQSVTTK